MQILSSNIYVNLQCRSPINLSLVLLLRLLLQSFNFWSSGNLAILHRGLGLSLTMRLYLYLISTFVIKPGILSTYKLKAFGSNGNISILIFLACKAIEFCP